MSDRAKIRRGPARGGKRPTIKRRQARRPSRVSRWLATIPVPVATLKRAGNYLLAFGLLAGLATGVMAMKLPQMIGMELGEAAGRAGFAVRNIEIVGRAHADRDAVYDIAMEQQSRAMPLVDLDETRAKLLRFGWISDARVSRRLPDTLVVDIVERTPAAIWQYRRRLSLIDKDGVVIAPVNPADMPDLPLVIGPGANERAIDLTALLETAPALKPLMEGASWIGARRWDLRFQSGETLALPEGQKAAVAALAYFAERDAQVRLLGQGYVRFDMRDPSRMVVRVSKEPGRRIAEPDAKSI